MNPKPATKGATGREPPAPAELRGQQLFVARRAWVVLAILALVLFAASVPRAYARWRTACEGAECDLLQLTPGGARALEELGLSLGIYATYVAVLAIVYVLGFWLIGTIIFWKGSDQRLVYYASVALVTFGAIQPDTLEWLAKAQPVLVLPIRFVYFVGNTSFFVLFCVFPDGHFVPRWTRWAAVAWVALQLLFAFNPNFPSGQGNLSTLIDIALQIASIGLVGSLVVAQVHRYRRVSEGEARQKTKWVVFGFTAHIAVLIGFVLIALVFGLLAQPGITEVLYLLSGYTAITFSALLIPLSITIAILRQHLWDIDLIINRALVFGLLSAVLATVFAITNTLLLPLLVQSVLAKENPSLTAVVSAVIIAVLFEPLRRNIQTGVDRLSDRIAGNEGTSESPR